MTEICLVEGTRCGRYVLVRDREGTLHAVAASAVVALCEHEGTTTMLLPGGRVIVVEVGLPVVLGWLEVGFSRQPLLERSTSLREGRG